MSMPGKGVLTTIEYGRFMAKVHFDESGCWLWTGHKNSMGYGYFAPKIGDRYVDTPAHRIAYEEFVGPIPEGLHIDHLCRVPLCVNPDHLEPVTQAENNRRGVGAAGTNFRKTHCIRGHEFTEENIYRTGDGRRNCVACRRLADKRWAAIRKERRQRARLEA